MHRVLAIGLAVALAVCGCAKGSGRAAGGTGEDRAVAPVAVSSIAAAPSQRSTIRLDLAIAADLASLEGSMNLRWVNQDLEPVDQVRFLLYPGLVGGRMDVVGWTIDGTAAALGGRQRDAVRAVRLPRPLAPGASVQITASWRTAVPATKGGGPLTRSGGFASLAWCFPVPLAPGTGTSLPTAFADYLCTDAASWQVHVSLPAGLVLVTGATETGRLGEDGRVTVDLELDPARDFYLAVGTNLKELPALAPAGSSPAIRCFVPPGREAAASFAMDVAGRAIAVFAKRFGPYPYGTFTVLCGPLASLGIEFPGLTVVGDHIFALEGMIADTPIRTLLEATVAHEVAHQWFYNLVGNDQAAEPWLDEAAAQYATRLYYLDRYGKEAADSYAESWYTRWNRVDRAVTPIGLPASDYSEKQYGAIVYGRGPLFLEALASSMGSGVFDRFLSSYVDRYAWRIAHAADFESAAEEQCRCELDALFAAWVGP